MGRKGSMTQFANPDLQNFFYFLFLKRGTKVVCVDTHAMYTISGVIICLFFLNIFQIIIIIIIKKGAERDPVIE